MSRLIWAYMPIQPVPLPTYCGLLWWPFDTTRMWSLWVDVASTECGACPPLSSEPGPHARAPSSSCGAAGSPRLPGLDCASARPGSGDPDRDSTCQGRYARRLAGVKVWTLTVTLTV